MRIIYSHVTEARNLQLRNFMLGRFGKTVYIPVDCVCPRLEDKLLIEKEECVSKRGE